MSQSALVTDKSSLLLLGLHESSKHLFWASKLSKLRSPPPAFALAFMATDQGACFVTCSYHFLTEGLPALWRALISWAHGPLFPCLFEATLKWCWQIRWEGGCCHLEALIGLHQGANGLFCYRQNSFMIPTREGARQHFNNKVTIALRIGSFVFIAFLKMCLCFCGWLWGLGLGGGILVNLSDFFSREPPGHYWKRAEQEQKTDSQSGRSFCHVYFPHSTETNCRSRHLAYRDLVTKEIIWSREIPKLFKARGVGGKHSSLG